MYNYSNNGVALIEYFRKKSNEIINIASQVIAKNATLRGNHLELVMSKLLKDFIPKKYTLGTGVVFDPSGKQSLQSDVVIWDEQNYPRIEQYGHNLFFVESVKAVLEIKTNFSSNNMKDIINKCERVNELFPIRPSRRTVFNKARDVLLTDWDC
ncbi:hypothetical protein P5G65_01415 [Paenibacillus chondroitinus]|uniref:DUF6602 domain-containing protein n=1 Tax=Paenibacillus chondroitinus TaxID=59842 RepID=A0ABU6D4D8_9BACL|nr:MULTISPECIES: DUF6602 domain-containing protein [Paenibacillus]MCY9661290.1 hypothetical protein [Paenibacillus anseongense]MEB4792544.1 hypothetical protein [Paenibacillus chondroitinus]